MSEQPEINQNVFSAEKTTTVGSLDRQLLATLSDSGPVPSIVAEKLDLLLYCVFYSKSAIVQFRQRFIVCPPSNRLVGAIANSKQSVIELGEFFETRNRFETP